MAISNKFQNKEMKKAQEIVAYVKVIDEIPDPDCDMKYKYIDTKITKYLTHRTRGLFEYRYFMDFLKKTLDVNHCAYFKDYSMESGYTVEMHHSPFTMFDLCQAVANKFLFEDGFFYSAHVAMEVMKLHYEFKVGLIPLNPTAHQLVHSGELKVHPDIVVGEWELFAEQYKEHLSDEALGKYEEMKALKVNKSYNEFPKILQRQDTVIETDQYRKLDSVNVGKLLAEQAKKRLIE